MTESELQRLLEHLLNHHNESDGFVEFKTNNYEKTGEYISALSNEACLKRCDFGFLIFGVSDNNKIVGTTVDFRTLKRPGNQPFEMHLRTSISPAINFEIFHFKQNRLSLALIRIPAAKGKPTEYLNKSYCRIGENKTELDKLSEEKIRTIWNSAEDWSAKIIDKASFEDLDPKAVEIACQKIREKSKNLTDQTDPKVLLDKARITVAGKITNASLVLLGRPESTHFLSPSQAEIIHRLVGWNLAPNEITSKYFLPPFLLTLDDIWKNIRNSKIKVFTNSSLFPDPVDKYDSEAVLEALNNCIAHQDYNKNSRIILTERPDRLIFESSGSFFEGKVEDYLGATKTPKNYRNKFLADAMRALGIIDIEGSGIDKIYRAQIRKFFPAPDYKTDDDEVSVTIYGKTIDEKFSEALAKKDLDVTTILLLDRVQKKLPLTMDAEKLLKKQKLIEGRKGGYFIAAEIALVTNQEESYLRNKGADNQQLKDWVLSHLEKFTTASRTKIDGILVGFLSGALSEKQKKKKVTNLLHEMSKKDKTIKNVGTNRNPKWIKLDKL